MRTLLTLLGLLLMARPAPVEAQSALDLLQSVSRGGGWVRIPIQSGKGALLTPPIPTFGVTLTGCMQVYPAFSGVWDITARDPLGNGLLEASVPAGQPVNFSYQTGPQAQLSVEVEWSEPRDTTLLVWVGLATPGRDRDPCEPVYGTGS